MKLNVGGDGFRNIPPYYCTAKCSAVVNYRVTVRYGGCFIPALNKEVYAYFEEGETGGEAVCSPFSEYCGVHLTALIRVPFSRLVFGGY